MLKNIPHPLPVTSNPNMKFMIFQQIFHHLSHLVIILCVQNIYFLFHCL